ncbi:MAG: hypothetical protein LBF41_03890, partial [Deltaproteobacteria bacterium]|nr:hypothetical protein [Deltaproteobacteria bacterium]
MSELKIIFSILGVILLLLFGFLWYSASNQRDDLNSKLKNLQTRFNETADERDKMRSQLNAANSQADSLNQQLTAAKQKATRDKNELDNLNARINSLNRDTESTEAQIRNLGRDKAALLEELDALKSSPPPTDLTADVHTLLSERELLKNKLVEVRSYVLYTLSGVSLAPPDNLDNSDLAALSAIADPLAAPAETAAPGTVEAGTVVTGTVETGTTETGTTDAGTTDAGTTDAGTVETGTTDAAT